VNLITYKVKNTVIYTFTTPYYSIQLDGIMLKKLSPGTTLPFTDILLLYFVVLYKIGNRNMRRGTWKRTEGCKMACRKGTPSGKRFYKRN
jgi:hypothetical protein